MEDPFTGCGEYGADPLSDVMDTQAEWNYYQDNQYAGAENIVTLTQY